MSKRVVDGRLGRQMPNCWVLTKIFGNDCGNLFVAHAAQTVLKWYYPRFWCTKKWARNIPSIIPSA